MEIAKLEAFPCPLGSPRLSERLDQHQNLLARNRGIDTYKFHRVSSLAPSSIAVLLCYCVIFENFKSLKTHKYIFTILAEIESTHPLLSRGIDLVL